MKGVQRKKECEGGEEFEEWGMQIEPKIFNIRGQLILAKLVVFDAGSNISSMFWGNSKDDMRRGGRGQEIDEYRERMS